jgi:AbrB family looped-hinge helix DNA binding protein
VFRGSLHSSLRYLLFKPSDLSHPRSFRLLAYCFAIDLLYLISNTLVMKNVVREESAVFSVKGQIVIPSRLRKQYEIANGTKARIVATPEGILIKPITREVVRSQFGKYRGKDLLKALAEEKKAERGR